MKHLFTVHSPLTFLSAHLTIQQKGIDPTLVIIITEGYKIPINLYKTVVTPAAKQKSLVAKLRGLNFPKYFDQQIAEVAGNESFIAYIDFMSYHQRLLVTHKNCAEFHFIEEGSLTYLDHDNLNGVAHLDLGGQWRTNGKWHYLKAIQWYLSKAIRGYPKRIFFLPFHYRGYAFFKNIKYYCFSDLAYPGVDSAKRKVLDWSLGNEMLETLACGVSLNNTIVWIDDSLVFAYPQLMDTYFKALQTTIAAIKKEYPDKKHVIKLRPGKSKSRTYNTLITHFPDIEILPNEAIIEAILLNSNNCVIVGNVSIVLFYGAIMEHTSITMFPLLQGTDALLYKNGMNTMWSKIKSVEELLQ